MKRLFKTITLFICSAALFIDVCTIDYLTDSGHELIALSGIAIPIVVAWFVGKCMGGYEDIIPDTENF